MELKSQNISSFEEIELTNNLKYDSSSRKGQLSNNIKQKLENTSNSKNLLDLCLKYEDIFHLKGDVLSKNNFYTQTLCTTDQIHVYTKNYRTPYCQKSEIDKQIKQLMSQDVIEPSQSSYNSPILLVPKKSNNGDKKWSMCIDFRQLNKKLVPDKYPLPRIDEILDNLGRAKWFSTLDLTSGFHQIPLVDDSKKMTSFSTSEGSFQYKVLPFGLNVVPNSFARMMALAFTGLKPETCFLYLDDIIVVGSSESHHLNNLELVFKTCKKRNLKLNPYKCDFLKKEVQYLGSCVL